MATGHNIKVIPLGLNDQFKPMDNIRSLLFFLFHDSLNHELLKSSLDTLIREHLPILGARLHRNKSTNYLEYHLPQPFPENHILFDWSTSTRDTTLEAANLIPQSVPVETSPSFGPLSIPEIEARITPQGWPVIRKDEKPGCPLLLVHIVKYTNGTVLALNLPHSVGDQMGFGSVVKAWLQVASGEEPTPFLELEAGSLDGDPKLSRKELKVKGRYRLKGKRDTLGGVMGMVPELMVNKKEIRRVLYLPTALVDNLRTKFNEKIKESSKQLVLTNGDVISALLFKLTYLARKSPKWVTCSSALNVRGRLRSLPQEKPYLHNAVLWSSFRVPMTKTTPLLDIAMDHRLSVIEGLKPDTIVRNLTVLHEMVRQGESIHIIEPWETSYAITNWCGAWRDLDFGPVVLKPDANGNKAEQYGSFPLVYGHSLERKNPTRFNAQIMCKVNGGYWCDFTASVKAMAAVDLLFEEDPSLESV